MSGGSRRILQHHPHAHCIVTGGGLSPDGTRWIATAEEFFLPIAVLKKKFRGKFLSMLKEAHAAGRLAFHGRSAGLADPRAFNRWLTPLYRTDWIVYCKPPFASPACVLKYLARYTHRVAISDNRVISADGGEVTFTWKDYAQGGVRRLQTLPAEEFIRRFLLHVLPKNFVRIRYYGLWSNSARKTKLARCRELLGEASSGEAEPTDATGTDAPENGDEAPICPVCRIGRLQTIAESTRPSLAERPSLHELFWDTS